MTVEDFEIEDIEPRVTYTATASQTTFVIPFPFRANEDIKAYTDGTLRDAADYTITGAEDTDGGQLVFDTGLTVNTEVTIARDTVVTRTSNFTTSGSWTADAVNREFQRLTLVLQEIKDLLNNRVLTLPATTLLEDVSVEDEGAATNAGKSLIWNPTGTAIINGPTAEDISNASAIAASIEASIADAQALVDDIDTAISSVTYLWAGTAGGTANGLTLTPNPALGSYTAGVKYRFLVGTTNTSGSVTLNVSALGTKDIKKTIGGALVALSVGDLQAGTIVEVMYDGTQFQLMNIRSHGQGADVASAGTINLDTATGDYVNVTGTTTITAITLAQGRRCLVKFAGALQITNGASLLNLSGANITTAAGDIAEFVGEASGVVRMASYHKADGTALVVSTATYAANTALANATTGTAAPTGVALSTSNLLGRGASGNIAAITLGSGLSMTGTELDTVGAGGTVTSVATSGGLTGGTITTSGTISINTNNSVGVGAYAILKNFNVGGAVANGATAAGSALQMCIFNSSGTITAGSSPSGTWRNVSGVSVGSNEFGMFIRTV